MNPTFSIIIPTYNRRDSLLRCLRSLEGQAEAPPFEVIVVDDGSTDGTRETLAEYRPAYDLRAMTAEHAGPAAARNRAASEAQGECLLFVDDDVKAHPRLLSVHSTAHLESPELVVLGVMAPPEGERLPSWARWEQEVLDKQYRAMLEGRFEPTPRQFYTANASLARRHFQAAGGFDPHFRRAEDVEMAFRLRDLGLRFVFQPDAIVTHYANRSLPAWWKVPYQYGVYDVRIAREKGRHFMLGVIAREFPRRHPLVRSLTRALVGRPSALRAAAASAVATAVTAGGVGLFPPARSAYSLAFNLLYYQGLCDELGSAAAFRSLIADGAAQPAPGASRQSA